MKIWKKVLIGLGIFVVIVAILGALYIWRYQKMVRHFEGIAIEDVDLAQIADGVYAGEFGEFLVAVKLNVTVKDHKIVSIEITDQRSSPDHKARETIDRIIAAQSPNVDAVTGATGSSMAIMIAVQKALRGE